METSIQSQIMEKKYSAIIFGKVKYFEKTHYTQKKISQPGEIRDKSRVSHNVHRGVRYSAINQNIYVKMRKYHYTVLMDVRPTMPYYGPYPWDSYGQYRLSHLNKKYARYIFNILNIVKWNRFCLGCPMFSQLFI